MDGVRRMIAVTSNHHQIALVTLCGFMGLRVSEARSIVPKSFDLEKRVLTVRGKGDKVRQNPITDAAWHFLAPVYLIAWSEGWDTLVPYADRSARELITTLGERAGLKRRIASHDLRATFATATYANCKDPLMVQRLMGHESVETTQIYIEISMDKLREAAEL
jgi:site-specific recombinase XerD